MRFHNRLLPVVTFTGSSLMVGCGGNSGSCSYGSSYGSSAGCAAPLVTGDGYYEGTLISPGAAQGTPVVAIIAENGDGAISAQDGTYYRLNVSLPQNNVSGTFYGISQGANFPNGSKATSGSISATATASGLSGTLSVQTAAETLSLSFDTVYNLSSSLATLAGPWSYTANGFSLSVTIRPDGTFSGMDSNNCSYTGAFTLIDPNFNAYSESYARLCSSGVNVTFTGLATYFPSNGNTSPAEIKILADDNASEFLVADLQ